MWDRGELGFSWEQRFRHLRRQWEHLSLVPRETALALAVGCTSGATVFAASRLGVSFVLQSLRISSHNRLPATVGGAAGMVVCSGLAAHTVLLSSTLVAERSGIHASHWPLLPVSPASPSFALFTGLVAVLSWRQFLSLGGKGLWRWAPSDVMKAGSFAQRSMPAPGNEYADQAMKRALWQEGVRAGCHHCGRSKSWWGLGPTLSFIGDHIPPNKYAKLADAASGAVGPKPWWQVLLPFLRPRKTPQVFLPQCERCSAIQSAAVRADRRTLIFPRSWRLWDLWLPFPLLLTMLLLPFLEDVRQKWRNERSWAKWTGGW
jgi:hypothetical protein